jgi:hypothetical protein
VIKGTIPKIENQISDKISGAIRNVERSRGVIQCSIHFHPMVVMEEPTVVSETKRPDCGSEDGALRPDASLLGRLALPRASLSF